jgi:hypothetical protein
MTGAEKPIINIRFLPDNLILVKEISIKEALILQHWHYVKKKSNEKI